MQLRFCPVLVSPSLVLADVAMAQRPTVHPVASVRQLMAVAKTLPPRGCGGA